MRIGETSAEGPRQPSSRVRQTPAPRASSARQSRGRFVDLRPLASGLRPTARILLVGPGGALRAGAGEREESGERGDLGGARARTRRPGGGDRGGRSSRSPPGASAAHPHSTGRRRPTGRRIHRTQPVQVRRADEGGAPTNGAQGRGAPQQQRGSPTELLHRPFFLLCAHHTLLYSMVVLGRPDARTWTCSVAEAHRQPCATVPPLDATLTDADRGPQCHVGRQTVGVASEVGAPTTARTADERCIPLLRRGSILDRYDDAC